MTETIRTPWTVASDPRYRQQSFVPLSLEPTDPHPLPAWDLDGVAWYDADPPPRFHDHIAQSVGSFPELGGEVWRCPCGAFGGPLEPWVLLDKRRAAPGWLRRLLTRRGTIRMEERNNG